ncbi:MAG: MFS transporter, partial [Rhodobacteraceae bacterium]|nr:MFS transporter [Paracoccaceae bacterium]
GMALGPAVLILVGVDGWAPFLAAGALSALALIPLALAWRKAPMVDRHGASGALKYFWTDPSLLWAVVLFGVVEFGAMGLTPVWGVRLGFTETAAVALTMALAIGGAMAQPALGWAADRYPERPLLLLSAASCVAVAAMLPLLGGAYNWTVAVFALWGGMAAALYTVSLTALGGRYRGGELAAATAAIVTAYGLGALIGPLLVGGMMDLAGPHGLSIALGAPAAAFCILVIARARRAA